jgi:hypothetical protein
MSIPVSCTGWTPPFKLRQAPGPGGRNLFVLGRKWEWEWDGVKQKAEEVTNGFFERIHALGQQQEPGLTTKNILSGLAWHERKLSLAVESDKGLACQECHVTYFAGQRTTYYTRTS